MTQLLTNIFTLIVQVFITLPAIGVIAFICYGIYANIRDFTERTKLNESSNRWN